MVDRDITGERVTINPLVLGGRMGWNALRCKSYPLSLLNNLTFEVAE